MKILLIILVLILGILDFSLFLIAFKLKNKEHFDKE